MLNYVPGTNQYQEGRVSCSWKQQILKQGYNSNMTGNPITTILTP